VYYTVTKHSGHLRTLEKCRKHSPAACVFYISLVFSNGRRVLSQCNTRLRLLYLLNNSSSVNKGNPDWYGVRIFDLTSHKIVLFSLSLFSLVLVLTWKMDQTLDHGHISRETPWCLSENPLMHNFFNSLLIVWKCGQTECFILVVLHEIYQSNRECSSSSWIRSRILQG